MAQLPPAVNRAFEAVDSSVATLAADMQSNLVLLKLTAEDLERETENCKEAKLLDGAILELIAAANELERHKSAMHALKQNYQFTPNESTDFQTRCQDEMNNSPAAPAKDHPFYKQFQEAIWNVHKAGIPMPGQEQTDIFCTTQSGVANKTCPISGKPVTELEKPVRCTECRHIYDHEAAIRYIGRKRDHMCAVAGCPKRISIHNLTCDASLHMEIAELRMRGEIASHSRVEELADVMDLGDDAED